MPKGGIRPRNLDGSLDHLIKLKWQSGPTRTIRVPIVLAEQLLEVAHKLDIDSSLDLSHGNKTDSQVSANQRKAISLLRSAITPKKEGGSYEGNNATRLKRLVEQALELLESDIS